MRERLPKLLLMLLATTTVGGCSKLYDPDRLRPAADAPPPPIDIEPCDVMVTDVSPTVLYEGVGAGRLPPALVVISGKNLVNQNTTVTLKTPDGTTRAMQLDFDSAKLEVGAHGEQLAVPVSLPVDTTLPANEIVALDIVVAQDCPEGRVTAALSGRLALKGLDELPKMGETMISLTGGVREYSQIDVGAATTITVATNEAMPTVLRSMSSVKIAKDISLNAPDSPASGDGGAGGSGLGVGGAGGPGTGPYPGLTAGAPGRFDSTDMALANFVTSAQNRSSGGAGGNGVLLGGKGGNGGGGGGAIEISAAGDLEVGAISARGAAGAGGSAGGQNGGGGSGGVILLRAGGMLKAGALDVAGAGTGARGRARYDAVGTPTLMDGPLGTDHYRGPMFVAPPQVTHTATLQGAIIDKPLTAYRYFVINGGGGASPLADAMTDTSGNGRIMLRSELQPGTNQLCIVVEGANATSDTRNCVDIAYLR